MFIFVMLFLVSPAAAQCDCVAGQYVNLGACTTCPAGSECPDNSTAVPCLAGTYSGPGQVSCTICKDGSYASAGSAVECVLCPGGHHCSDRTAAPFECLAGTYAGAGSIACTPCASGHYAAAGQSVCTPCPPGSECGVSAGSATPCTTGYYSSGAQSTCTQCVSGTRSSPDNTQCLPCTGGSSCADPTIGPQTCGVGHWSVEGVTVACTICPAGHECSNNAAPPVQCSEGTHSAAGATSCDDCPAGKSCLDPASNPVSCDAGFYSLLGDHLCHRCPAGMQCSSTSSAPTSCDPGFYSNEWSPACTECPAGFACNSSSTFPIACPLGEYAAARATECTLCAAGQECPDPSLSPSPCASGYYSLEGYVACIPCAPGQACPAPGDASPTQCLPGTYSTAKALACTPCSSGFACPVPTDTTMIVCQPGSFSTGSQSACTPCPAGVSCASTSSSATSPCASGTYSFAGEDSCSPCPSGWQCPSVDGAANEACPPGYYSPGSLPACAVCTEGNFCTASAEFPCPTGWYSGAAAAACLPCPPGFSCGATLASMAPCNPGDYSAGGVATCSTCLSGFKCPSAEEGPIACEQGSYSLGGATTCTPCPPGEVCTSTATGGTGCAPGFYSLGFEGVACAQCPEGHQCSNPTIAPVICPVGTYAPSGSTTCDPCTPGYQCAAGSSEIAPAAGVCPKGGYCPASNNNRYVPCSSGTYGNVTGAAAQSECAECLLGYYCPAGTVDPIVEHSQCPKGHYCPAGTDTAMRYPCDEGFYMDEVGASDPSDCKNCPEGSHCPRRSDYPEECPPGYYCPPNTGDFTLFPCPAGYYGQPSGLKDATECTDCPAGFYCEVTVPALTAPQPCPAGTYQPALRATDPSNCLPCDGGSACPSAAMTTPSRNCSEGHYCPAGTSFPNQYPCNAGTYTWRHDLTRFEDCDACPGGFACGTGTGVVNNPPQDCALGYYCPPGTSTPTQFACPEGTFGNLTSLTDVSNCTTCPAGYFCASATTAPSGICPQGSYCPAGTQSSAIALCPEGTYNNTAGLSAREQCDPCPAGQYCSPSGRTAPTDCPDGTYSSSEGAGPIGDCLSCPPGYACPSPTINPVPCGTGSYSPGNVPTCPLCPAGHFCDSATTSEAQMLLDVCMAGTFCPDGQHKEPDLMSEPCPGGHYCPAAASAPVPCGAGTYQPVTGAKAVDECVPCSPGYYCLAGAAVLSGKCSPGHYCPTGTPTSTEFPCPPMTYHAYDGASSLEHCAACQSGYYCPAGTGDPIICDVGYYCPHGSLTPEPCRFGTFGNGTGLRSDRDCTPCPGGYFCDGLGLSEPRGPCDAGYYCVEASYTSSPTSLPEGGVCPEGGFCSQGSSKSEPCPLGTFNNFTGGRSSADCVACPPGSYCAGSNNPFPTGPCDPGYYCTGNADTPVQFPAPEGTYTGAGASSPLPCEPGTYQNSQGQASCLPCLPGYYCDEQNMTAGKVCPSRKYCPEGSPVPVACPAGTFSAAVGLSNVTLCTPCTPGYYCLGDATTESGLCNKGFVCYSGISTAAPPASKCPVGHWCGTGTFNPTPCGPGFFNPIEGGEDASACISCTPGSYCATSGLGVVSGPCHGGYYCVGGEAQGNPPGQECSEGHFCAPGSSSESVCLAGTYMNATKADACLPCPLGYYCAGSAVITPQLCTPGHYCDGGRATPLNCPQGTYSTATGLKDPDQCTPCDGGWYCDTPGIQSPTNPCDPGHFCDSGVNTATPAGAHTGVGGVCPRGFYCGGTTSTPSPCPVGTFSDVTSLTADGQCQDCLLGRFCETPGLSAPTGVCAPGFFCLRKATSATPPNGATGGQCPIGFYCPANTSAPIACDAGTYADTEQHSECDPCPQGHFCTAKAAWAPYDDCPPGYYCPEGTASGTDYPCPPGTFSNVPNLVNASQCTPCTPGFYCGSPGLASPTDPCGAGYYCSGGASVPTPLGSECPVAHFCPTGSAAPTLCSPGYYCIGDTLASPTGPCAAGFYCLGGAVTATPTTGVTGDECSPGQYCPVGSDSEAPCPPGTYSNAVGSGTAASCNACTPGHYCSTAALLAPTNICDLGYYCPGGQSVSNPAAYLCPAGHRCPAGSSAPILCSPGYYQPNAGLSLCISCPIGHYCTSSNASVPVYAVPCPRGYYCELRTETMHQYPCPPGTFLNKTGAQSAVECIACTSGSYCAGGGLSEPTDLCLAAHYCTAGSDDPTQNVCGKGHYCAAGSSAETPCPAGTSSNVFGATSCPPCPSGLFCEEGAEMPSGNCAVGFVCIGGASTATPMDGITGFQCPAGHRCPTPSPPAIACAPGTFQPDPGMVECIPCTAGYYCPTYNMSSYLTCPAGTFCPPSSATAEPCPAGTYSTTPNVEECLTCPRGKWCAGGVVLPDDCSAGFFCDAGAVVANPDGTDLVNGPCSEGYFCLAGTLSPVACDAGTFNPSTGGDNSTDCLPCLAGSYCPTPGQGSLPSPPLCRAGYYCPADLASPVAFPVGYECIPGHYCPEGSEAPEPCPPSTYSQAVGTEDACLQCPKGYFCNSTGTIAPIRCPPLHFCEAGSAAPTFCLDGSYDAALSGGFDSPGLCEECPAGRYCRGGVVMGSCTAGYICWSSSGKAEPDTLGTFDSAACYGTNTCGVDPAVGGFCPKGFHCPLGTTMPIACTNQTVNPFLGGWSSEDSCVQCPAGFQCEPGNPVPVQCPPGYYCEAGESLVPCPVGSYNADLQAESIANCLPCIAGNVCDELGLANFTKLCPPGYFCPTGTSVPLPCEPGRHRPIPAGFEPNDCPLCQGGTYCPRAAEVELSCPAGTFCPVGSANYTECGGGTRCPLGAEEAIPCVAGYYCPVGAAVQRPCPAGHFCPALSAEPLLCPLGSASPDTTAARTSAAVCVPCPPGTHGSDSARLSCGPCAAGYVCWGSTTTSRPVIPAENGERCPLGSYCPEGAAEAPFPCPKGTFGGSRGLVAEKDCKPCPAGSYGPRVGLAACLPCGASAWSEERASVCKCNGTARAFQPSDGFCTCIPGHEYYTIDELDTATSFDSTGHCQPIVRLRCRGAARSPEGACIKGDPCREECVNGQGTVSPEYGLCDCSDAPLVDEVCDATCRANQFTIALDPDQPGVVFLARNASTADTTNEQGIPGPIGLVGEMRCDRTLRDNRCNVATVAMTAQGFKGLMDASSSYYEGLLGYSTPTISVGTRRLLQDRHLLQDTAAGTPGITSPLICIRAGDTMLFDVSSNRLHYPVYTKNSLFNTNPNFDYGAFRELERRLLNSNLTTRVFAHTFTVEGVYAFHDAPNPARRMIVRVVKESDMCPDASVQAITSTNLVEAGAARNDKSVSLEPDWWMIGSAMAALFLVVLLVVLALHWYRHNLWKATATKSGNYSRLAYGEHKWDVFAQKDAADAQTVAQRRKHAEEPEKAEMGLFGMDEDDVDYKELIDLEGFNVRTLYDKLYDQNLMVADQIGKSEDFTREMMEQLQKENRELKETVFSKLDHVAGARRAAEQHEITDDDREAAAARIAWTAGEVERRKKVAAQHVDLLEVQSRVWDDETKMREQYEADQRGAVALFMRTESLAVAAARAGASGHEHVEEMHRVLGGMRERCEREKLRRGPPGPPSRAGVPLCRSKKEGPVPLENLTNGRGELVEGAMITEDVKTHLFIPSSTARVLRDGKERPSPPDCFVHPQTGAVEMMVGSAGVDCSTGGVVIISGASDDSRYGAGVLPYVPASLVSSGLKTLAGKPLKLWQPVQDHSGQVVPTLAATVDPASRRTLPLGGTYVDPVTRTRVPIDIGAVMENQGKLALIVGVAVEPESGEVIPVGGNISKKDPLLLGVKTGSVLSGDGAYSCGAALDESKKPVVATGGYGSLLDASELASEGSLLTSLDTVLTATERVFSTADDSRSFVDGGRALRVKVVERAEGSMVVAREKNRHFRNGYGARFRAHLQKALRERDTGGIVGDYRDPINGQAMPILIGGKMYDPVSGQETTIVGTSKDHVSGDVVPVGGMYTNPTTGASEAIVTGAPMRDPVTGDTVTIVGAVVDTMTGEVVPSPHTNSAAHAQADLLSVGVLAREMAARESHAAVQQRNEAEVRSAEDALIAAMRAAAADPTEVNQAERAEALARLHAVLQQLDDERTKEAERRGNLRPEAVGAAAYAELTADDDREHAAEDALHAALARQARAIEATATTTAALDGEADADARAARVARIIEEMEAELRRDGTQAKVTSAQASMDIARSASAGHRQEASTIVSNEARRPQRDARGGGARAGGGQQQQLPPELAEILSQLVARFGGEAGPALAGGAGGKAGGAGPVPEGAAAGPASMQQQVIQQQAKEREELDAELAAEEAIDRREFEDGQLVADAEAQQTIDSARKKLEEAVKQARANDDPAAAKRALAEFNDTVLKVEEARGHEREKQRTALRAKVAAKRKAKWQALADQQVAVAADVLEAEEVPVVTGLVDERLRHESEAEEALAEAAQAVDEQSRKRIQDARKAMEEALASADSPSERTTAIRAYQAEVAATAQEADRERDRQREIMRAKIAAKQARAARKREQVDGGEDPVASAARMKEEAVLQEIGGEVMKTEVEVAALEEAQALADKQAEQAVALIQKQQEDLANDLLARGEISEEEREQMLAQFQAEAAAAQQASESERNRQQDNIRRKIEAKRKAKEEALARKHSEELAQQRAKGEEVDADAGELTLERQDAERKALMLEMERDMAREIEEMRSKLLQDKEALLRQKQLEMVNELAQDGKLSENERAEVLRDHERSIAALNDAMADERATQRAMVRKRMEEKKRKRKEKAEREKSSGQHAITSADGTVVVNKSELAASVAEEAGHVQAAADVEQARLEEQQQREKEALERQLKQEQEAEERRADEEAGALLREEEAARARDLAGREAQMEKKRQELEAAKELSEQERSAALAEYEDSLKRASASMESERERQRRRVREKRETKRQERLERLAKKHEKEKKDAEQAKQDKLEAVKAAKEEAAVVEALASAIQQTPAEKHQELIQVVLEQHHADEMRVLMDKQKGQLADAIEEAVEAVNDQYDDDRHEMKERQQGEMDALRAKHAQDNPGENEERHKEEIATLETMHNEEESSLSLQAEEDRAGARTDVVSAKEREFLAKRFELKERQYNQFATLIKELSPENAKENSELNERRAQELSALREKLEKESVEQEKRHASERDRLMKEAEVARQAELDRLKQEADQEINAAKEKAEERMKQMREEKMKELEVKRKALEKDLLDQQNLGELDEDEVETIKRRFDLEAERLESTVDKERKRQKARQRKKLARKRARQFRAVEERMRRDDNDKTAREARERQRAEKIALADKQATELERKAKEEREAAEATKDAAELEAIENIQAPPQAAAPPPPSAEEAPLGTFQQGGVAPLLSEDDWERLLSRLDDIEATVQSKMKTVGEGAPTTNDGGGNGAGQTLAAVPLEAYSDVRDAQWVNKGALEVTEGDEAAKSILSLGASIVDVAKRRCDHPGASVILASSLPPNRYLANAYRNSYWVDDVTASTPVIHIRAERVESAGEFVVVLAHALAHVQVREMSDDTSHKFLEKFHGLLHVLCDAVFSRSIREKADPFKL